MQLSKKSGMRNRVKGLTEVDDGNISAEARIQGPDPIVDRKNELFHKRIGLPDLPYFPGAPVFRPLSPVSRTEAKISRI